MDRALAARTFAYLFAAGGLLVFASLALPHGSQLDELGVAGMATGALLVVPILVGVYDRMPLWGFHLLFVGATCLITGVTYFSGGSGSAYPLFYLWVSLCAFYFLKPRQAVAQLAWIATAYGLLLILHPASGSGVGGWLITIGTVSIAGIVVGLLRDRLDVTIGRLADAARTDPLTGLLNRTAFRDLVEVEIERARRSDRPVSLLLADLDGFKELNRRLGDQAGDRTLRRLGALLGESKRRIDGAARTYGEEFALIVPDTDEHGAYLQAERTRLAVQEAFAGDQAPLTISFGVVGFPAHAASADELVRRGEQALDAAKQLGRNRTVLFSPELAGLLSGADDRRRGQSEMHVATVLTLAEALDIRDTGTSEHSKAVGRYAELIARELGLSAEAVEDLRLAGLLHDVGKIGVSDRILGKPGPLTEEEWKEMRKHPEIGAQILATEYFETIRNWVLAHHERPDGSGYPFGRALADTPLEARILAVADAYEAMTADRVYRPAIGHDAACEELKRCSGTQFDEAVVAAFLAALKREGASARRSDAR
jgi:diguanylate cyclase (GGDEF)-like protein/putative nucleotidyltransferase with HDIG domain